LASIVSGKATVNLLAVLPDEIEALKAAFVELDNKMDLEVKIESAPN
jgi:hypothetical protein